MTQQCNSDQEALRQRLASLLPVEVFQALADPNRIALLASLALGDSPQTVTEVARRVPVDLSVVSRHLKVLARAGVLASERRGREVHYRVRAEDLVARLRALADVLEQCCGEDRAAGREVGPTRRRKS